MAKPSSTITNSASMEILRGETTAVQFFASLHFLHLSCDNCLDLILRNTEITDQLMVKNPAAKLGQ